MDHIKRNSTFYGTVAAILGAVIPLWLAYRASAAELEGRIRSLETLNARQAAAMEFIKDSLGRIETKIDNHVSKP